MTQLGTLMTKLGVVMTGYLGLAILPGCMDEVPTDTQADESALVTAPSAAPNMLGAFSEIRMINTSWCLRPQGGSPADGVPLELSACAPSAPNQNWELRAQPSGRISIINAASGLCIYNEPPLPVVNGARPIVVGSCFLSNNPTVFASNTLWKRHANAAGSSFETEIQFRDTGFCLDIPSDAPGEGVQPWNFSCNGTGAQLFSVE